MELTDFEKTKALFDELGLNPIYNKESISLEVSNDDNDLIVGFDGHYCEFLFLPDGKFVICRVVSND